MSHTNTPTVPYLIRTKTVGRFAGILAEIIDVTTGRTVATTDIFPYGSPGPAMRAAEAIAAQRGYEIVGFEK